jgi:hypothetical protein
MEGWWNKVKVLKPCWEIWSIKMNVENSNWQNLNPKK